MIHSHWQDIPHQFLTQAMTNSSLNIQLMKCNKRHLLSQKERRRAAFAVQKDDILDLVSKAWDESFAHIATNQKAVFTEQADYTRDESRKIQQYYCYATCLNEKFVFSVDDDPHLTINLLHRNNDCRNHES